MLPEPEAAPTVERSVQFTPSLLYQMWNPVSSVELSVQVSLALFLPSLLAVRLVGARGSVGATMVTLAVPITLPTEACTVAEPAVPGAV